MSLSKLGATLLLISKRIVSRISPMKLSATSHGANFSHRVVHTVKRVSLIGRRGERLSGILHSHVETIKDGSLPWGERLACGISLHKLRFRPLVPPLQPLELLLLLRLLQSPLLLLRLLRCRLRPLVLPLPLLEWSLRLVCNKNDASSIHRCRNFDLSHRMLEDASTIRPRFPHALMPSSRQITSGQRLGSNILRRNCSLSNIAFCQRVERGSLLLDLLTERRKLSLLGPACGVGATTGPPRPPPLPSGELSLQLPILHGSRVADGIRWGLHLRLDASPRHPSLSIHIRGGCPRLDHATRPLM
jgi:hypothetical protein